MMGTEKVRWDGGVIQQPNSRAEWWEGFNRIAYM